jgi:hypothetical protein
MILLQKKYSSRFAGILLTWEYLIWLFAKKEEEREDVQYVLRLQTCSSSPLTK